MINEIANDVANLRGKVVVIENNLTALNASCLMCKDKVLNHLIEMAREQSRFATSTAEHLARIEERLERLLTTPVYDEPRPGLWSRFVAWIA